MKIFHLRAVVVPSLHIILFLEAKKDYLICFKELYEHVDYFVVNVSSPNTPGLRELQSKEFLSDLFEDLNKFRFNKKNIKPILLKISPDLSEYKIVELLEVIKQNKIDGIIEPQNLWC